MITYNAFGYSTNGETINLTLNERQVYNLLQIIKGYKEELCGSNQDKRGCEELIKLIHETMKKEDELNEKRNFNHQ